MKKLVTLTLLTLFLTIPVAYPLGPGWEEKPIHIQLLTDKEYYNFGEDVNIEVQAVNTTNTDITLHFPSSYQADYCIDANYLWSRDKGFTQAFTSVEIPVGESYSWYFVHTADDYLLSPGKHVITGMIVGYGHSKPVAIAVGERKGLKVTVSSDKESYSGDEEIPIHVTITNETDSEVVLHFRSGREAGYSIDDNYVRYNGSDALDVARSITLKSGESDTWDFVHDPNDYPLAAGKHSIKGIVIGYGESDPITIVVESGLEITVRTDKEEYALDEYVEIFVTATNNLSEAITLKFRSSHQASYIIDGRYDWSRNRPALTVITEVTIEAGKSETWEFTHTSDGYRLLPGSHSIVGIVIGYGKSEPTKIVVGEGESLVDVSVSTDKEAYDPGDPVKIKVTAKNVSEGPVTLRFPTLHYADYQIDDDYLWSRGKFFLPIPISFTIPHGVEVSWEFVHGTREAPLDPGDHSIVGIVVGYGRSEPLGIHVNEKEPGEMTIQGLLVRLEKSEQNSNGFDEFLLYTRDSDIPYYLFHGGVDLAPHVNMTVEVTGHPVETFAPVPGNPFEVMTIRDILRVEVETDKREYYQPEDIAIYVIARNLTKEVFTLTLDSLSQVIARLDGVIVPGWGPDIMMPVPVFVRIPAGGTHVWKFVFRPNPAPLSPGEHFVSGEILAYGKSKLFPIKIIEKPSKRIVVEGIVDTLVDDTLGDRPDGVRRYVLLDQKTAEKLYILRNPEMDFGQYLGQFVEVEGVLGLAINGGDPNTDMGEAIPELFIMRIRRLLAVAVATNKTAYSLNEAIRVYVTARNCTPKEMTLSFDSEKQAYYSINSESDYVKALEELREGDSDQVTIGPYGLHVWQFEHDSQTLPTGEYTVIGGVYGYGLSKPATLSIEENPPTVVTATGIIEKVWWRYWNWFNSSWYVLLNPEEKQVAYFLSSRRVELNWYLGMYVEITGYTLDLAYPQGILGGYAGGGDDGSWRPIPPILPPLDFPEHLDVVSVLPVKGGPPSDENGNGLPDGWEIATGLDGIGAGKEDDSDGDGVPNLREYLFGTDPLDAASVVKLKVGPDIAGMVTLRWDTVLGKTYSLYCADGLSGETLRWRRLVGRIEGTGAECIWTDDGAPDIAPSNASGVKLRFYRVEVE